MVTVTYHCPRCGAVAALERDAYLADKCVTPAPLDGWEYVPAYELDGETDPGELADGVELVCGATETKNAAQRSADATSTASTSDAEGCGEPYYLSFVKFEAGEEVDPRSSAGDVAFDFLRQ
jgi:hypothetical protein